jgi:hypothetical protein
MRARFVLVSLLVALAGCAVPPQRTAQERDDCRMVTPTGSRVAREVCGPVRTGAGGLDTAIKPGGSGALTPGR